jgi:addiction module RelE/StbE family toxin
MEIFRHRQFVRQIKKLPRPLRAQVLERLQLHAREPAHPLLNDHKLHHPYDGYSSIKITGDYRLVYKKLAPHVYFLRAVGTHHQLFGT